MRAFVRAILLASLLGAPALAATKGGSLPGDPGPQGAPGPAGAKGDTGAQGPAGVAGPKGDAGQQGAVGATGATGATGAQGPTGPQGPAGAMGATGPAGPAGAVGATGPTGPKASTFVCATMLSDTIAVGLSSGVKSKTGVACAGVLTTDLLEVYPTDQSKVPEGVAIHHAFPTAASTMRLVYSVPQVSLLTTLAIPVAIYAVNR